MKNILGVLLKKREGNVDKVCEASAKAESVIGLDEVEAVVEDNIDIDFLMNDLIKWRNNFIELKKSLNHELKELDRREKETRYMIEKNLFLNTEMLEEDLKAISNRKKEIIKQKNIIRKLDCDGELTYGMIGKKINNYKYFNQYQ